MHSRPMGAFSACLLCGLLFLVGQAETKAKFPRGEHVNPSRSLTVFGGSDTYRRSYMVSLRDKGGKHRCGGTLIAPNIVLTSAVCLQWTQDPTVHVGRLYRAQQDDFEEFNTIRAIRHPEYNSGSPSNNDIALLVLDSQSSKDPVELQYSDSCFEYSGGCQVKVLGWGKTADGQNAEHLQEGITSSVSRNSCKEQLGSGRITGSMICAGETQGGIDACQGDAGGPLLESDKQVGIVSWGIGCAEAGKPGVYTSIPKLAGWIQQEVDKILR